MDAGGTERGVVHGFVLLRRRTAVRAGGPLASGARELAASGRGHGRLGAGRTAGNRAAPDLAQDTRGGLGGGCGRRWTRVGADPGCRGIVVVARNRRLSLLYRVGGRAGRSGRAGGAGGAVGRSGASSRGRRAGGGAGGTRGRRPRQRRVAARDRSPKQLAARGRGRNLGRRDSTDRSDLGASDLPPRAPGTSASYD